MGERTFRFDRQVEGSGGTPAWPRVAGGKRFRAELDQVLACVDRKTDPTAYRSASTYRDRGLYSPPSGPLSSASSFQSGMRLVCQSRM